jgi:protein-disulfide isomerase
LAKKSTAKNQPPLLMILLTFGMAAAVFFLVLLVVLQGARAPQVQKVDTQGLQTSQLPAGQPVLGAPTAKVILGEFSNFSCPSCLAYEPKMKEIIDQYVKTGQARLAFMPMTFSINDAAEPSFLAAQAAMCAVKQNKFWEIHTVLFNIQREHGGKGFSLETITNGISGLGIETPTLVNCINSGEMQPMIRQTVLDALQTFGVEGTPTVLYSLDEGQTFQFFKDATGNPVPRPDAQQLGELLAALPSATVVP